MGREPIPTWFFALVVVRLGRRFLLVQEAKHELSWYLPGGRLKVGESLLDGARRETMEESGIAVELEGVLRMEHTASPAGHARCRVIFLARPRGDDAPKATPDDHSIGAGWFTLEQMKTMKLRGPEVISVCEHVLRGGAVYPLRLLGNEGGAWE